VEIQETRRDILDILKQKHECTVEEIVTALSERLDKRITTVTVRHHLERLRAENLVKAPEIRRRSSPGRPQYVYCLTEKAFEYFPNNYAGFANSLLSQMKSQLGLNGVNVILEDMADTMAAEAGIPHTAALTARLNHTVDYLNEHGYEAAWEETSGGYLLTASNCPYERVVEQHGELCTFDLRLVASLLGVVPRYVSNLRQGDHACQYFIPA
jgi:DeoR family transcriptional regulator, suf operon transcriptional repressor